MTARGPLSDILSANNDDSSELDNKLPVAFEDGLFKKRTDRVKPSYLIEPVKNEQTKPGRVRPSTVMTDEKTSDDLVKNIAFNSREIRLMGPDQKEVEMKDDVGTKMVIALENLQKEAVEAWGQVNEKLDKGWTELKSMIDDVVTPSKNKQQQQQQQASNYRNLRQVSPRESLVVVSDVEGYSMADEPSPAAGVQGQLEQAGTKIKGFFSDIGLNEANKKKAGDALSKAGDSVSATVTKDIPDALKKAGSVVSDTVTKDIPDAFKNFFG